jgi:nucleoside-diphosphate-sugar epimerase
MLFMKNVIITGANGMVGKLVLEKCLLNKEIATVTTITRKLMDVMHPKLKQLIHSDFLDFSSIELAFKNKDICFYCIGVYTGQVPTAEFQKITVVYTEVFARALKKNSNDVSFCFLSGQGADSTEKSKVLFAREKGIAENILLKLQFKSTHIFRPAYIFPETPRQEPNFLYKFMRFFYKPIKFIFPSMTVTSTQLANKMVEIGLAAGEKIIYENVEIKE